MSNVVSKRHRSATLGALPDETSIQLGFLFGNIGEPLPNAALA